MKSLRSAFKTSPRLETEGIKLEMANARITLARAGGANTKFNAAMAKIAEQHKRAIATGLLGNDKAMRVLMEVYAETVVLDWETNIGTEANPDWVRGIDFGDEPAQRPEELREVTFENVLAFFHDMPDFFLEVKDTAENVQAFREALIKGIAGN